jgi:S-adenosylmethionine-diacylglycerol 3-amino-3-carboxypropyl transferase
MTTEISQRADFSQLRYAQCWEDADLLLRGLAPASHHRLLSIASAGDNTLALVAQGVERVVAIDLSVAQIASLELRVAAYRTFDYPEAMQLFGVLPGTRRLDSYAACRAQLSTASQQFWDAHNAMIEAGIISQGRFERYLRLFGDRILPFIHSAQVRAALLQRRNLTERCRFYTKVWDTWRWRLLFRIFFSRPVMARLGRDPAFFRYAEGDIATSVLNRVRDALTLLDPTHNPYLQWILLGRYGSALPYAFRPQNYQAIRRNLHKLEWHTVALEEYLAATQKQFNGFNLSNIFEYMNIPAYHSALEQIMRVARPNARLVYWNLLAPRRRPNHMADQLLTHDSLAVSLHRQDRAFFYSALIIEQVLARN